MLERLWIRVPTMPQETREHHGMSKELSSEATSWTGSTLSSVILLCVTGDLLNLSEVSSLVGGLPT